MRNSRETGRVLRQNSGPIIRTLKYPPLPDNTSDSYHM